MQHAGHAARRVQGMRHTGHAAHHAGAWAAMAPSALCWTVLLLLLFYDTLNSINQNLRWGLVQGFGMLFLKHTAVTGIFAQGWWRAGGCHCWQGSAAIRCFGGGQRDLRL